MLDFRLDEPIHYETPQAWLTSGYTPVNSTIFLASELSSSFLGICRQPIDWVDLNLMGELIMTHMDWLHVWFRSAEFLQFHGLWLVKQFRHMSEQSDFWIHFKGYRWIYNGPHRDWLTFSNQVTAYEF